jgi:hypothetical protein
MCATSNCSTCTVSAENVAKTELCCYYSILNHSAHCLTLVLAAVSKMGSRSCFFVDLKSFWRGGGTS